MKAGRVRRPLSKPERGKRRLPGGGTARGAVGDDSVRRLARQAELLGGLFCGGKPMNTETGPGVLKESDPREPSWSQLVERIRTGDPAGMEQLYGIFIKGVRFFLWRQLGPQDLDDKVHDVFLIITQSIQRGELREPDRLMGYVRTIVRRQVAAYIELAVRSRRNHRSAELLMGTLADRHPDPERTMIARQSREVAMRVLNGLPQRD